MKILRITTEENKKYLVKISEDGVTLETLEKKDLLTGAVLEGFFVEDLIEGQESIFLIKNIDEWITYTGKKPNNENITMIGFTLGIIKRIQELKEK